MIGVVPRTTPLGPSETGAVSAAAEWLSGLVAGSLAATLSVIGIALVGFLMFSGRVPVRAAFTVVLGCFILLGAPAIASALMEMGMRAVSLGPPSPTTVVRADRPPLPRSTYDPYAGASLRQD